MSIQLLARETDSNGYNATSIWIAAILMFIITTLTLAIRLWIKWRKYSYEDGAILVGSTMAYAQFGAVTAALCLGLRKPWSSIEGEAQARIAWNLTAAKCLYILSLGFMKMGIAWPVRNIYHRVHMSRLVQVCNILLGSAVVWTVGSLIILSAGCDPGHILPKSDASSCSYNVSHVH